MMEAIKKVDDEKDEEMKKWKEEQKKKSGFKKLLKYNKPCILVFSACIASCITGGLQPTFSMFFSKVIGILTLPLEYIPADTHDAKLFWIETEVKWYCTVMCFFALGSFIGPFF